MRQKAYALWAAAAAMLAASAPQAGASTIGERSPLDFDEIRSSSEFADDAAGLSAGPFRLWPSLALISGYDSNILASSHREGEPMEIVETLLRAENEPGAVDVEGRAFVRARRFPGASDQDTNEFGGAAMLDDKVNEHDELAGHVLAQRRFESRTDIETPQILPVSLYRDVRADVTYTHTFDELALHSTVSGEQLDYELASQRYRDMSIYGGEIGAAYQLHGGLSLFGSVNYTRDAYRFPSPVVADADTVGGLAGLHLDIPDIAELEAAAGYFSRTSAQQAGNITGVSARATVTLHPTRLTRFRADLVREDQPTVVLGALGKVRTVATAEVDHSYSRTFALYLRATLIDDQLARVSGTERTWLGEVGGGWLLSSNFVVAVESDYASRNSAAVAGDSFVRNVVSVTLTGRY
jgi:hypothetical protein